MIFFTCLFYLPFLVTAPNRITLENSSLFLWAPLSRAMRTNSLSAVSKFSTTPVRPGLPAGFQSGGVHRSWTNDAQPCLLAEGLQELFFFPPS